MSGQQANEQQNRRARINRIKLGIVVIVMGLIGLSLGLNIFLMFRVVHLSNIINDLLNNGGLLFLI